MRRRCASACCVLFLAAGLVTAGSTSRRYTEVHPGASIPVEYSVAVDGEALRVSAIDADLTNTLLWSRAVGTFSWRWKSLAKKTDLDGERTGDVIRIHGTLAGKPVSREIRVDGTPWYQIWGPVLDELLPGLQGQREFWVVNPDDASAHKMLVKRGEAETITLGGTLVDAIRIHFSPAGALAPFWGADYWLRARDSVYVYSRLPEPGNLTVTTIGDPAR